MAKAIKHVGILDNGSKVIVPFRTIPGDSQSALVIESAKLSQTYHDEIFNVVDSPAGQEAVELANVLGIRKFSDGTTMLEVLHATGKLKKVPTSSITMTPLSDRGTWIKLDELNLKIAEQRGVTVEDLAVQPGTDPEKNEPEAKKAIAKNYRSRADALYKEVVDLRRRAEELDPSTKVEKKTTSKATA
jgi:hypothetical protein